LAGGQGKLSKFNAGHNGAGTTRRRWNHRWLPAAVAENNYYGGFVPFWVLYKQETHNEQSPNEPRSHTPLNSTLLARRMEHATPGAAAAAPGCPAFIHSFLSGFVVNNRFLILIILMPAAAFHLTYIFLLAVLWLKYFNYCQCY